MLQQGQPQSVVVHPSDVDAPPPPPSPLQQPEQETDVNRGTASSSVSEDENSLQVSQISSSSYLPTPIKKQRIAEVEPVNQGMRVFVCLTSQVAAFIEQLNQNMQCQTIGCYGVYVPSRAVTDGLGGAMKIIIA